MYYVIFILSVILFVAELYCFYFFPKCVNQGIDLFWRNEEIKNLKTVAFMSKLLAVFCLAFFFVFCLLIWGIWYKLQPCLLQKLSFFIFSVSAVLLLAFVRKMILIRLNALNISHLICENNILKAEVEEQRKGLWICKFNAYHEKLRGYLDEKPSGDIITVAVMKYDNKKKMYLLQEMH